MSTNRTLVVFTDLDGTLLDHDTYSYDAACGALARLGEAGVPVVFCSSKTRAEIERVRREIGNDAPFISENGAAAFVPEGYFPFAVDGARRGAGYDVLEFGRPYGEVIGILRRTAALVGVEVVGFSDMSVQDVAEATGLSLLDARLAMLREYDEPFRILDPRPGAAERLLRALRHAGLRCTEGGRFHHVTGWADKGAGVAALRGLFERAHRDVLTIGLGDGPNDVSFLLEVDIPVVVVNRASGATEDLVRRVPGARVTAAEGPLGWGDAVNRILQEQDPRLLSGARDSVS